jgi:VanZ family protein
LSSPPGSRLLLLGLAYAAFVVYGSLVPLEFRPRALDEALAAFGNLPYLQLGVASRADWVANILLYIPLGFLLAGAAGAARPLAGRIAGTLAAIAGAIGLAVAVEFAQLYFPPRTVSQNDLIAEAIGTLLGVALWLAVGPRIVALAGQVRDGGPRATRAALVLYVAAYLAFSLFPYDFLVSGKELADKLAMSGRSAWVLSDACGDVARCNAKLLGEILLAAPLGMLYGMLRGRDRPAHYGRVFLWGLALGAAIEGLQIFLASGVSQGASILARGLGVVWGLAFQRVFDLGWFTRNRARLRRLAWIAAPAYAAIALYVKGLLPPELDASWAALEKLRALSFLPFYYHYYTSETEAMQSLLLNAGLYLPVGLLVWITRAPGRDRATRWLAAAAGAAAALAVETLTLFTVGKRADPTNLLIAAATSYLIALGAQWLEHGFPAAAPGRAAARPRASVRTMVVLQTTSAIIAVFVLIGGLVVATPHREQPVDERVLPKLAPGHELPPVSLPKFRVAHPRLPHPSAEDLATLRTANPGFLNAQRASARGGHGDLQAAILTEFVEPGSQDLNALLARLAALKPEGRGHDQARPIVLAYDWLYDRLTDAQRAALRDKLAEACNYLVEFIRVERLSPYNVILYNAPFQALVACAIAIYRDDARGEPIMRFTHDLWKNRVLPVWRQVMGRAGGWHEGGEYVAIGIGQAIYRVPAMWRHATGEDYIGTEPGVRGFLDFLVYRTQPDGSQFRWGDGSNFERHPPDALPLAIELRHRAAYSLRPPPKEPVPTAWPWGPLTDAALLDREAVRTLPLVRLFDGLGLLVARSDWTPEATYVTFKAGDNYWSHVHLDQGAFTIYKGGPLAIDSGLYGPHYGSDHHMNYSYQTIAHNTITVTDPDDTVPAPGKERPRPIANDGGQRRVGSGWGVEAAPLDRNEWQAKRDTYHTGRIERVIDHNGVIALVADLTPAYTNRLSGERTFSARTRRVERALRVFGYDRIDDVVIVYDDVEATDAAFRKRWLLHAIDRPEIAGNRFTIRVPAGEGPGRGGGRLDGHVVLPESPLLTAIGGPGFEFFVDGRNYDEEGKLKIPPRRPGGAGPEPGAWRIELSPQREALSDRFLVVLLPAPLGAAPAHEISRFEEGLRLGLEIKGPQRITRWLFDRERGLADVRVIEGVR